MTDGADMLWLADGYRASLAKLSAEERAHFAERITGMTAFSFIAERNLRGRSIQHNGEWIDAIAFYRMEAGDSMRYWTFYLTAEGKTADLAEE